MFNKKAGLFCVKYAYRMTRLLIDTEKHEEMLKEFEETCLENGVTQEEIEVAKIEVLDQLLSY
ncbi:hypothetical protein [Streptococcus sp. S784/96/1]|uniref:hypothetical protein n=1 Tax=Streptococcus sp. S784/96/1 TaxID=2653499 RepID=UPI001386C6F9|nr:hypothetical protein [Streptococcus sp. S784/96/1]